MSAVLVDSNVLIDVMAVDVKWGDWSAASIIRAIEQSRLVINSIIYAEVSVGWPGIEQFDAALPKDVLHREEMPFEAAFLAGKCFAAYRRKGGTKRSPLPDFFIGAHAAVRGYRLLTRDAARYRTYFPTLEIIAPTT